ncbi:uncharacterized protein LOC122258864 [Penaeus japonicus]|uniref:uncharacterized protein LOC122258864 n=1 Tax=Penaeus japonicus TaxID=27405 RepID=UPI001C715DD9|nr:uncharacterized protein LOC122258864 [Penaeus japonicus]
MMGTDLANEPRQRPATMVVTSRMLAAHTSGYPVDVRARFWSNYYRSLKGLPPVEHYWDSRYHQRRESPPRFRVLSSPWWHHIPELRPADAPQEYLPVGAQHDLAVRPSFLSPVKRKYVWTTHPQRQAYSLKK